MTTPDAHPRRQNDATRQGTHRSTATAAPRAPPPPKRSDATRDRHEHGDNGNTRTPAAKMSRRARALTRARRQRQHAHPRRQNDATRQGTDRSTATAAPRAPPPPKRRDATRDGHEHGDRGTTCTPDPKTTRRTGAQTGAPPQRRHAHPSRRKDGTHQGTDRSTTTAAQRAPQQQNGRDAPRHWQEI